MRIRSLYPLATRLVRLGVASLPEFIFEAVTEDNEVETGQIRAASAAEAIAELESRSLTVHSLQQFEPDKSTFGESSSPSVESSDISASNDQFLRKRVSAILAQRETLAPALEAFAEEMPRGRRRRTLHELATRLHSGTTVDEICQSKDLSTTWLALLGGSSSVGSGRLLSDLLSEASRENTVHSQWTRLFAYPAFILLASFAVLVFLSLAVVPTFVDIFNDFELDLPDLTVMVVSFSNEMRFHPVRFLLISTGCLFALYVVWRLLREITFSGWILDALTSGNSRQLTAMATFVSRLAESLNTGLPLPTSLRLAGQGSRTPWLHRVATELAHELENGRPESNPFSGATGMPASVAYALTAGPEGGPNIRLLQEMADIYSERVRNRFDWSTGFLSQVSIVVVGLVVGLIVIALFIPLVELINGLTG